jgi:hypothetical protein
LKPYWGKPAVRNFRGGGENTGVLRNVVHAVRPLSTRRVEPGREEPVDGPEPVEHSFAEHLFTPMDPGKPVRRPARPMIPVADVARLLN